MAMEDRETFNLILIGSDIVEGTNEYGPDGQKSVTSSVSYQQGQRQGILRSAQLRRPVGIGDDHDLLP